MEAVDEAGEQFGESRLIACLAPDLPQTAAQTLATVMRTLETFVGNAHQHDDITCLALHVTE